MNKTRTTVIGIATVCASLAGTTVLADPVNLYGVVEVRSVDRDDVDLDTFLDAARLGAQQSIQLDKFDDLTASWQMEFDLPTNASAGTDDRDVGDTGIRKALVSLESRYGEGIFGRQDNLMVRAKKMDQFKNDSAVFLQGPDRVGNAISYITPSFGGLTAYAQVVSDVDTSTPAEDADAAVYGASLVGDIYDVHASYYEVDPNFDTGEVELVSVGGSVSLGPLALFATYQNEDVTGHEVMGAGATYLINDLTLRTGYTQFEDDASQEGSAIHLLADYNLGHGVSTFAQYVEYNSDAETLGFRDAVSVGIAFSFSTTIPM